MRQYNDPPDDDEFIRDQLRTLQSVDRAIGSIVARLRARGLLDNTVVIFTSDNGYHWDEHGVWGKSKPYEESMRVPLIVSMPGVPARSDARLVSPSLDLGATVYDIAGVWRKTDGRSLVPLLQNPGAAWRTQLFFEHAASSRNGNALWAGVTNQRWKYVRYWTGEEELYDLRADPFELNSRHRDPSLQTLKASFAERTRAQLGLAIVPVVPEMPAATYLQSYAYRFELWGGKAPYTWVVASGQLPPGLTLDSANGTVHGTPVVPGTYRFQVRVTDSAWATQARKPRTFLSRPLVLTVT